MDTPIGTSVDKSTYLKSLGTVSLKDRLTLAQEIIDHPKNKILALRNFLNKTCRLQLDPTKIAIIGGALFDGARTDQFSPSEADTQTMSKAYQLLKEVVNDSTKRDSIPQQLNKLIYLNYQDLTNPEKLQAKLNSINEFILQNKVDLFQDPIGVNATRQAVKTLATHGRIQEAKVIKDFAAEHFDSSFNEGVCKYVDASSNRLLNTEVSAFPNSDKPRDELSTLVNIASSYAIQILASENGPKTLENLSSKLIAQGYVAEAFEISKGQKDLLDLFNKNLALKITQFLNQGNTSELNKIKDVVVKYANLLKATPEGINAINNLIKTLLVSDSPSTIKELIALDPAKFSTSLIDSLKEQIMSIDKYSDLNTEAKRLDTLAKSTIALAEYLKDTTQGQEFIKSTIVTLGKYGLLDQALAVSQIDHQVYGERYSKSAQLSLLTKLDSSQRERYGEKEFNSLCDFVKKHFSAFDNINGYDSIELLLKKLISKSFYGKATEIVALRPGKLQSRLDFILNP